MSEDGNDITPDGVRLVAEGLKANRGLLRLDLGAEFQFDSVGYNMICDEGVTIIMQAIDRYSSLQELILRRYLQKYEYREEQSVQ